LIRKQVYQRASLFTLLMESFKECQPISSKNN
jgi:hypothetical protein